ncbi:MAG: hypothetical protein ACTIC1_05590 [Brevibacterium sp.]|uniref:hypothetical protein n=1 Tax=Brevibacterium aurantiacum TaxID=273384 RepID=UPI003F8DBF82
MDNTKITSVIKNVAKKQATDVMDADDLEQDLWVFFLSELADTEYPEGTIVDLIKKRGVKIARDERIDYMQFRGAFIYSPAVVRTILEDSTWTNVEDTPDVEGRMDVSNAMAELEADERHLLRLKFGQVTSEPDHAPFNTTEHMRIERAIDKISMILNRGASRSELDIDLAAEEPSTPAFA